MTTIRIPTAMPPVLSPRANARNGRYPTASFSGSLVDMTNQALFVRSKEVARFFYPMPTNATAGGGIPASGGAGEVRRWNSAFHSSPMAGRLWAAVTQAEPSTATGGVLPYVRIRLTDMAGSALGDAFAYGRPIATSLANVDVPSHFTTRIVPFVNASNQPIALSPDADLALQFSSFDQGRVVCAMVYEQADPPDTANGYIDPSLSVLGPILDVTRQSVATLLRSQWKRGAAHLFNHGEQNSIATATPTNVVDNTTVVSAATAGWTIDLTNRGRLNAGVNGVLCTLWVYAKDTGSSGQVRLVDSSGSAKGTITGFTSSSTWRSTTFFLPASVAKYALQFFRTTSGTLTIGGASLYLYES